MNAQRLRGLIRKEAFQILRDPSSLMIAFLLPVVLLLLFGYGISLDAKHIPIAFVVAHPSEDATSFQSAFAQSEYFIPQRMQSMREAEDALMRGKVDAIVYSCRTEPMRIPRVPSEDTCKRSGRSGKASATSARRMPPPVHR